MLNYLLRRILIFVPTLFVISLLAYMISINAPGDPVERLLNAADNDGAIDQLGTTSKIKQDIRKKLGLDLPLFYFALGTMADCDTLYKVPDKSHRSNLSRLTRTYGNWDDVAAYYGSLHAALKEQSKLNVDTIVSQYRYSSNQVNEAINKSTFGLLSLQEMHDDQIIHQKIDDLNKLYTEYPFLNEVERKFIMVEDKYLNMISNTSKWKTWVPSINFYGLKNQYHRWVSGIVLRGDFGVSYRDQQPILKRIKERFVWSFSLTILSVLFSYLVSIPIGIYSAYKRGGLFDQSSSVILFVFYSLPNFFVGTLLLVLFANPDFLAWFPEAGVQDASVFNPEWPWYKKIAHHWPYLILPLITYSYSQLAFLSRQMRVGMVDVINKDYIRTARAKGLSEKAVVTKHALRNALLPIITVFANIFPLSIGGSVIIETIFSIPGMGYEIVESILNYDYPMIVAVFTIIGFLTLVGYLVADLLYAIVDPRISYK